MDKLLEKFSFTIERVRQPEEKKILSELLVSHLTKHFNNDHAPFADKLPLREIPLIAMIHYLRYLKTNDKKYRRYPVQFGLLTPVGKERVSRDPLGSYKKKIQYQRDSSDKWRKGREEFLREKRRERVRKKRKELFLKELGSFLNPSENQ